MVNMSGKDVTGGDHSLHVMRESGHGDTSQEASIVRDQCASPAVMSGATTGTAGVIALYAKSQGFTGSARLSSQSRIGACLTKL